MTDNRTTELLPCPFCGGEASVKVLEYDDDCKVWGVFCESDLESEYSHGHFVDNYPTEAEAIGAWNTRAERTCKWEYPQGVTGWLGYTVCSSCGERFDECVTDVAHYCPNCGRRVIA